MRYIIILLLFLGILVNTEAQNKKVNKLEKIEFKKYALGISPSAILNYYSGIQLSHDIGVRQNVNLAIETGYIFSGVYSENSLATNGFRLKTGVQLMAASSEYLSVNLGISYVYRYSKAPREFTINFWEEEYIELVKFDRTKTVSAVEFNISMYVALTNRLRLEMGMGMGPGIILVEDKNSTQRRNEDSFQFREFNFNLYDGAGRGFFLLGSFNINLSYILIQ